jgi:hypothetical protein
MKYQTIENRLANNIERTLAETIEYNLFWGKSYHDRMMFKMIYELWSITGVIQ